MPAFGPLANFYFYNPNARTLHNNHSHEMAHAQNPKLYDRNATTVSAILRQLSLVRICNTSLILNLCS